MLNILIACIILTGVILVIIESAFQLFNCPNYFRPLIGDKEYSNIINTIMDTCTIKRESFYINNICFEKDNTKYFISTDSNCFGQNIQKYTGVQSDGILRGKPNRQTVKRLYKLSRQIKKEQKDKQLQSFLNEPS
jgi:hypothetical protein